MIFAPRILGGLIKTGWNAAARLVAPAEQFQTRATVQEAARAGEVIPLRGSASIGANPREEAFGDEAVPMLARKRAVRVCLLDEPPIRDFLARDHRMAGCSAAAACPTSEARADGIKLLGASFKVGALQKVAGDRGRERNQLAQWLEQVGNNNGTLLKQIQLALRHVEADIKELEAQMLAADCAEGWLLPAAYAFGQGFDASLRASLKFDDLF